MTGDEWFAHEPAKTPLDTDDADESSALFRFAVDLTVN